MAALISVAPASVLAGTRERDPTMDRRTRQYVAQVKTCMIVVGLVLLDIQKNKSILTTVEDATDARDTCDSVRSNLLRIDTKHFDDEAGIAWYGVDRYKSGLNALLKFFDTNAPSKLIEARNKIQEGDANAAQGIKAINQRRRVYGLKPIK